MAQKVQRPAEERARPCPRCGGAREVKVKGDGGRTRTVACITCRGTGRAPGGGYLVK